jgi:hypothetical protein
MTYDWQTIAALTLVVVSASYAAWRLIRAVTRRTPGGCDSCGNCPAASPPQRLISIE